ncbi:7141_t:CDS:2 [Funneliformis caledonium]|uniref:Protein transport protein sec16 n=1 Tax=Funneliformis caledonium TaxID=1117310 RepID=A0A9N8WKT1_9GLOM|nr:7141_t:CDS:2 [Funneliformis caledonium]
MEGNAFNLDQENSKIAGAAAALFSDSIEQSPFDSLASEQTTTDYSSHYDYNNGSNALQENTDGTVTNSMVTQQYGGFEYNHYHEGQYVNGTTESVTSPQANTITQNQHDYTGYGYDDASYTNGQDNSQFYYSQQQYYDPSQQQYDPYYYQTYNPNQTFDPNQAYNLNQPYDPSQTYYPNQTFDQNHYDPSLYSQDPSTYYQYTQQLTEINNSNEINFQNLTIDPNSNKELSNSKQKEGGEDMVNSNGIPNNTDSVGEVGTTYDGSKQNIYDALKSDAVPSNLFVDTFKSDNENREISSDNKENEENKETVEHSPTINQDIDPNFKIQEHLTISSSSDLTSPINDNVAAVTLVETIETNKESSQYTVTSSKKENASRINSPAENDNDLNGLENEDQEVNITYGDDRDIFEYQPQELESHPKSELSQAEPPVSLIDDSKIMSEVSAAGDTEEINDKPKDEPTKLDDLDDLVLGSASKPGNLELEGLANTHEGHSIPSQNIDTTALNSSYQYEYSGQYNYGYEHWGSNDENSRYQGYDPNLQTGDVTTGSEQVNYQYQGYDASQTSRGTTTETDLANYQYNEYDTNQTAAEPITEKEQILYQSYDTSQAGFDNTVATNYQYPAYETNQSAAIETVAEADQSNYQYLGYNMGEIAVDGTDGQGQFNYPYQEHETGQATIDNNDETSQANYQYTSYDASQINHQATSQPTVDNKVETEQSNYYQGYQHVPSHPSQTSPPPMSPSPKGSILISCPYPQCGGENKSTAKFCSDCGKQINSNVMRSIIPAVGISEVMTTEIYNNANAYSEQYSASSFASYGNHDTQYLERDSGVSLDPLQSDYQQYYGTDDVNAVNDPLGRTKGCRPIIAFGFGGKMFTMFPRTVQRFTSTDQSTPITKSAPGVFSVRVLKDIIPVSDITDFPGPLLMDNNRGGIKAKRKSVLKYLDDQIQVTETKLSSFNGEEIEKKELEMIIIVWNLFKIMFENDGMLIGSSKVEELVRNILVPFASKSDNDEVNFTVPADTSFEDLSQTPESTSLTYSVSSKAVDKLQELLLKGDRVVAINHAMNENLWAHALIIASCVNKDLWKEVVTGFIKREMGTQKGEALESNGRESLRVLYSLFAGQGQNAAKEFLPYSNLLNRITQSPAAAMIPTLPNTSHYSSNPNVPYGGASISTSHSSSSARDVPLDSLVKWRETIAMILANRTPGDNQVISALGDMLKECGWVHAAHICYMLSPTVSIISGSDAPNVRFTLLGMDYTHNLSISNFHNWQSLRMTEIYEFGLSLNSNDGGLPHLQAYKLLYAWWLADCGYLNESRRYCESIANIVKVYTKGSPYFHGCFLQKLKDLTQRLLEHGGNNNGQVNLI